MDEIEDDDINNSTDNFESKAQQRLINNIISLMDYNRKNGLGKYKYNKLSQNKFTYEKIKI